MNKCIMCQKSLGTGDTVDKSKNVCNECFKKIINGESQEIKLNKCLQCKEKDQRILGLENTFSETLQKYNDFINILMDEKTPTSAKEICERYKTEALLKEENKRLRGQLAFIKKENKDTRELVLETREKARILVSEKLNTEMENIELKKQLETSILPKFNISDTVFVVYFGEVYRTKFVGYTMDCGELYCRVEDFHLELAEHIKMTLYGTTMVGYKDVFPTKEEAEKALKEGK